MAGKILSLAHSAMSVLKQNFGIVEVMTNAGKARVLFLS